MVKSRASVIFVKNHLPILLLSQITKECIPERHPLPASFVKSLLHNQLTSKIIKVFMGQDIYDKYFGHRRALEKHALSHIKEEIAKGE